MAGAPAKPVTVCAGLALALHAALLWPHAFPVGASSSGGPVAMAVRVMVEQAATAPVAVREPADPAPLSTTPTPAASDKPPGPVDVVEAAPVFTEGMPEIGLPDAALPPAGVQLRAWVSLGADGQPVAVTAGASDAEAPQAFRKTAERALMQAHFKPQTGGAAAHCLLVSFEPEANAARLAWLPGAARDAARCLAGPAPKPRDIAVAASAAG